MREGDEDEGFLERGPYTSVQARPQAARESGHHGMGPDDDGRPHGPSRVCGGGN